MFIRKYGQLMLGIAIGAGIMTATGASAAVGDKLEAIVTQFNFVVNGKQVAIDTPIVTIADSSYLPVRTISNMLGYDITYKADSRTIEMNSSVIGNTYGGGQGSGSTTTTTPTPPVTSAPNTNSIASLNDGETYSNEFAKFTLKVLRKSNPDSSDLSVDPDALNVVTYQLKIEPLKNPTSQDNAFITGFSMKFITDDNAFNNSIKSSTNTSGMLEVGNEKLITYSFTNTASHSLKGIQLSSVPLLGANTITWNLGR